MASLLPLGKDTGNNYIYTVLDTSGAPVGTLWFVSKVRANRSIAFVYDIYIAPRHRRRGHACRAFVVFEAEVVRLKLSGIALDVFGHNHAAQALYMKLGYVTTDINMFKPVEGESPPGVQVPGNPHS